MHTALGEPGLIGNLSDALLGVVTKSVENPKTFGPKSHVGLSSEGRLNSWSNSAPQRTGQTPNCPALGNFPVRSTPAGGTERPWRRALARSPLGVGLAWGHSDTDTAPITSCDTRC